MKRQAVLYCDASPDRCRTFQEAFPDLPVYTCGELPIEDPQVAALVIDYHLAAQDQVPDWVAAIPCLITTQDERPMTKTPVYHVSNGPIERATVELTLREALLANEAADALDRAFSDLKSVSASFDSLLERKASKAR